MELIKSARKHGSVVSDVIYNLLNLGLAASVFALVSLFPDLPVLAYVLVVLSKWRVLAVRPRFWWDNLQANFLDLMVGVSVVTMLWQARNIIAIQAIITGLYAVWLIFLKPMASRVSVQAQAIIAQFVAVTALFSVSYEWASWIVVLSMWLIGYVSARHTLGTYEEDDITLLSLIWGLVVAELGWVAYHWGVAYSFGLAGSIFKVPQIAIITALLGYLAARCYGKYKLKGRLKLGDVIWSGLFVLAIISILLVVFNGSDPNNS